MSIYNTCYDNIIGLSRTYCDCWDSGKPIDFQTSESGLYLSEIDPIQNISGMVNCENTDVWLIMSRARENAIKQFISDTNAQMIKQYKVKRPYFKGLIGEKKKNTYLTKSTTYAGCRLQTPVVRSGEVRITNIGVWMDTTASFNILCYNNYNELLHTIPVNSVAGAYTSNSVDITLPLDVEGREYVEYCFVYAVGSMKPANMQVKCSTCGAFKPVFNTDNPYYNDNLKDKRYPWQVWAMLGGFAVNTLDFSELQASADNQTNGLAFECEFKCNVNEVLCKDSISYTTNPLAAAMAHAILYKSAELTLRNMLVSTNINQKIKMNTETMSAFVGDYRDKYKEMLDYIVSEANLEMNDCLECKDFYGMVKVGIFA